MGGYGHADPALAPSHARHQRLEPRAIFRARARGVSAPLVVGTGTVAGDNRLQWAIPTIRDRRGTSRHRSDRLLWHPGLPQPRRWARKVVGSAWGAARCRQFAGLVW